MTKEELEAIGEWALALHEWAAAGIPYTDEARIEDIRKASNLIYVRAPEVPALLAYVAELEQDRNTYKACAESKETLYETACAGRESAQRRVANLERAIDDFITAAKVPQS